MPIPKETTFLTLFQLKLLGSMAHLENWEGIPSGTMPAERLLCLVPGIVAIFFYAAGAIGAGREQFAFVTASVSFSLVFFAFFQHAARLLGRVFSARSIAVLLLLFGLVSASVLFAVEYFPSSDGPNHLLVAGIAKSLLAGGGGAFEKYFEIRPTIAPNALFHIATIALSYLFGLLVAQKIAIALYFILLPLSVLYFIEGADARRAWASVFVLPFVLNSTVAYGFFNYLWSVPASFFLLGFFMRKISDGSYERKAPLLNLGALALYSAHLFGFALYALFAFAFAAERIGIRKAAVAVAKSSALAISLSAIFAAQSLLGNTASQAPGLNIQIQYLVSAYYFFPSYLNLPTWSFLAYWFASLFFLGLVIVRIGDLAAGKERSGVAATVLISLLLVLFAILPDRMLGWDLIKSRFLLFLVALSPLLANPKEGRKPVIAIILAVLAVSSIKLLGDFGNALEGSSFVHGAVAGLPMMEPNGTVAPFFRSSGYFAPGLYHTWAYYCIEKECASPQSFAMRSFFIVGFKHGANLSLYGDDTQLFRLDGKMFEEAKGYDYMTFDIPESNESFVERNAIQAGFIGRYRYRHKDEVWLLFENSRLANQRETNMNESFGETESNRTKP